MAIRSFRDMNPYAIGIISVFLIGAAVATAFAVGILHVFEDTYTVTAVFSDSAGMSSGDDVRVAGVKVGRITGVEADRLAGNVRIEMAVNSNVDLGPETTAAITLETLLGTKYVRLSGPVKEPYLADANDPVIPLERTRIPFDIFELARVGTRAIEETDTERLNLLVDQLATLAEGRRDDIESLVTGLRDVSGEINKREEALSTLLDRAETISATLDEKDRVLVRLLDQSKAVLDLLERRKADLVKGLEGTDTLTAQLASLTGDFKATLDNLLDTVHDTVEIVDERQEDLDRALAWLGPGALGLAQAVNHGEWADVFVCLQPQESSCTTS
ncbi:MAG: MCE family protein [Actinobacteria bacterium]|nr:MCE family protein [Actinomycetota bacterium]